MQESRPIFKAGTPRRPAVRGPADDPREFRTICGQPALESPARSPLSYRPKSGIGPDRAQSPRERQMIMARIHNFGAGPAAIPLPVLEKAQSELIDFGGSGMSLMEMSHRSKVYDAVHQAAIAGVRKLMNVPEDYEILFIQGGASQQFALIPQNLRPAGQSADYVNTGSWAVKAIKEAKIAGGAVNVLWDGKADKYNRAPDAADIKGTPGAAYLHICSNETIEGIRFVEWPKSDAPLLADMSSEIMSRVVDVSKFGMIYAGAQKNLGPSGIALVIIRKDLVERCPDTVQIFSRYKTHAENQSLYNTPNTWGIYILKLVTDWLDAQGGIAAIEKVNEAKAKLLYDQIDSSGFCKPHAQKQWRSTMNVVWRLPSEELEEAFVKEAKKAGMDGLKGHRSVGGIRASIYNACPTDSVKALVEFMKEFEKKNG
jgi:phosphoserine aminotransferase